VFVKKNKIEDVITYKGRGIFIKRGDAPINLKIGGVYLISKRPTFEVLELKGFISIYQDPN
jgi:hypothetical protein